MPNWLSRLLDTLAASLLALFAPIQTMLLSTGALVICDLITGVMAARKAGQPITSKGIKRTVVKLLVYDLAILLAHITEVYLTQHSIPVLNVVTSIIGITELKSCLENLQKISGSGVVTLILDRISSAKNVDNSKSPANPDGPV